MFSTNYFISISYMFDVRFCYTLSLPVASVLKASPRRRLGVHAPSTDLRLARLGARLARLGVQPPHLARRPPYRLENRASCNLLNGFLILLSGLFCSLSSLLPLMEKSRHGYMIAWAQELTMMLLDIGVLLWLTVLMGQGET